MRALLGMLGLVFVTSCAHHPTGGMDGTGRASSGLVTHYRVAIEAALDQIIDANPAQVEKAKVNPKLAGWFVGQVMKATGGKANPKAVNQLVAQKLGE